jgi:hypothetical protein
MSTAVATGALHQQGDLNNFMNVYLKPAATDPSWLTCNSTSDGVSALSASAPTS